MGLGIVVAPLLSLKVERLGMFAVSKMGLAHLTISWGNNQRKGAQQLAAAQESS